MSSLIPSPRDWQTDQSVARPRQTLVPLEHTAAAADIPGNLASRRSSFLHRVRAMVPRLSDVASKPSTPSGASVNGSGPAASPGASRPSCSSLADTVSVCAQSMAEGSLGDGQNSSPISAHSTSRWRVAGAQVKLRGQGALAAGREKVAVGCEKGRVLLASVSGGAEGVRALLRKVKAATPWGGSGRQSPRSENCANEADKEHDDSRWTLFGRRGRARHMCDLDEATWVPART